MTLWNLGIFHLVFYKTFMFCHTTHLTHCMLAENIQIVQSHSKLISLVEPTDLVKQDSHTDSHFFLRNQLMNGLLGYFFILSRDVHFNVEKNGHINFKYSTTGSAEILERARDSISHLSHVRHRNGDSIYESYECTPPLHTKAHLS